MTYLEFEDFVRESNAYLKARIDRAKEQFGIGSLPRYEYDLYRGEIWWSEVNVPKIRGKVTVVGSISTTSNTWFWSWANKHFSDVILGDIEKVRVFGETESITKLTESKWDADEVDGWEMTAIASRLLEAQGAYRSPSEKGFLYLLYDGLEPIPAADLHRYMPLRRVEDGKTQGGQPSEFERLRGDADKGPTHGEWPFVDPKNVVTFTVRDVVEKRVPILLVTHEKSDGMWQFLTGGELPEKKDWMLVALSEKQANSSALKYPALR